MIKKIIGVAIVGIFVAFTHAHAIEDYVDSGLPPVPFTSGVYIGLHAGSATLSGYDSNYFNTGFGITTQLGYKMDKLRAEGEFGYFHNTADVNGLTDAALELTIYMINFYYDFYFTDKIVPFIGTGMGLAHGWFGSSSNKNNINFSDNLGNELAYQVMSGVGYQVAPKVMIDLKYRYLSFSNYDSSAENTVEFGINYIL